MKPQISGNCFVLKNFLENSKNKLSSLEKPYIMNLLIRRLETLSKLTIVGGETNIWKTKF